VLCAAAGGFWGCIGGHDGCVGDRRTLTDLMMSARRNIRAKG
jgi:hypothetical protein